MMKVLAVAALIGSQFVLAETAPQAIIEVSEGLTDAKLTMQTETKKISEVSCTNSRAESYAIAYNTSGPVNSNIQHRGYHEVILVNCTGSSKYFNVETILQTSSGERFYGKTPVYVDNQAETIARFSSSVYAKYYNTGNYTLSSSTNVSGPGSARVTGYGNIGVY